MNKFETHIIFFNNKEIKSKHLYTPSIIQIKINEWYQVTLVEDIFDV